MADIVFVSPHSELTSVVKRVIEDYRIKNAVVVEGNLEEGLSQAQAEIAKGASIIISRGGTYKLLKKNLHTFVVELKLTIFDIANSAESILHSSEDIAVIGYDNIIQSYKLLSNINKERLHIFQVFQDEKIELRIKKCVEEGITRFIGDTIVATICRKLGFDCEIISSSVESVKMVLENAQEILAGRNKESEFNQRYKALMDSVHDGFIATDEKDNIIACNKTAASILSINLATIIGKNFVQIKELKDFLSVYQGGKTLTEEVITIHGKKMAISNVPIDVDGVNKGSVLIFQEVRQLQKFENNIRKKMLGDGFTAKYHLDDIKHDSQVMQECINRAAKYSQYDATVLIEGDTGVGKELFAQGIHTSSHRKNQPFVAVNCAALPESLLESELFGYDEGAFTGSRKGGHQGIFEMGHNGTVFLDEIGELPLQSQGRLLRVLQEHQIVRVGGDTIIPVDVRVICATNKDLKREVEKENFREDLLYRINVLSLTVPNLNDRRDDIPVLVTFYLSKFTEKYHKTNLNMSEAALKYLQDFLYDGNVRQLEGLVERGVIMADGNEIQISDIFQNTISRMEVSPPYELFEKFDTNKLPNLKELEKEYIQFVKEKSKSITELSETLGINRSTLYRKMNTEEE
jgi:transcriptional regulator with PAS, ATPase and Fis domain